MKNEDLIPAKKLNIQFDPDLLRQDLERVPEEAWSVRFPGDSTVFHAGCLYITPLMSEGGMTEEIMPVPGVGAAPIAPTPVLEACPYFQEVLSAFKCETGKVRLNWMEPGTVLKRHVDMLDRDYGRIARFHVPILTNPETEFSIMDEPLHMEVGEVWYFDPGFFHSVANPSSHRRVHLVADLVVNEHLNELAGFDIAEHRRKLRPTYLRYVEEFRASIGKAGMAAQTAPGARTRM